MNGADLIVLAAVGAAVLLAAVILRKKKGSGCGCGCSGCGSACKKHKKL